MEVPIRRLFVLLLTVAIASIVLVPIMIQFEFDPMPGDFAFNFQNHHYNIPVLWTLCAGAGLTLFYSIMKK